MLQTGSPGAGPAGSPGLVPGKGSIAELTMEFYTAEPAVLVIASIFSSYMVTF